MHAEVLPIGLSQATEIAAYDSVKMAAEPCPFLRRSGSHGRGSEGVLFANVTACERSAVPLEPDAMPLALLWNEALVSGSRREDQSDARGVREGG
ncbi:hypothetical protein ABT120_57330 [Nonomuraea angiospora]|uniref:hypothetical protein n=1 Tax=Nonomuraea angiospora TaxID=46172 RepID=UPI0033237A5B